MSGFVTFAETVYYGRRLMLIRGVEKMETSLFKVPHFQIRVLADSILIRKDAVQTMMHGIALPEQAQERTRLATVLAVGPGRLIPGRIPDGASFIREPMPEHVRPGRRIYFRKYGEDEMQLPGNEDKGLCIIKPSDVLAVMEAALGSEARFEQEATAGKDDNE